MMNAKGTTVDLGFAKVEVPPGSHVCQIFTSQEERNESLLKFLLKGLEEKERSACFSDEDFFDYLRTHFPEEGSSHADCIETGRLVLNNAEKHYFQGNIFDPDSILASLAAFHDESIEQGYSRARVIGEMHPKILSVAGGDRLLEYESRVNSVLKEHPVTTVCQYDVNQFGGDVIMDVLKSHPMMIVRGMVVHNPFYLSLAESLWSRAALSSDHSCCLPGNMSFHDGFYDRCRKGHAQQNSRHAELSAHGSECRLAK